VAIMTGMDIRTLLMALAGVVLTAAWSSTARADCEVEEPDGTVCDGETVAFTEQFVDGTLRGFQPPAVNGSDDVGYIAGNESTFDYAVFVRAPGGALTDALVSGGSSEGSFAGIPVSTLDQFPMFATDAAGNVYGMANVLDEFGGPVLGLVRGGPAGYRRYEAPASFASGTFVNFASTTEILVNDLGTLAFRAEIRADAGATVLGEGLFLADAGSGLEVLVQTGDAAADAGESFLGFFGGLNARTLALNDLGGVAFSALVSGTGIDAASDERLLVFDGVGFTTLAREGGAAVAETPNLAFGGTAANAFGWVEHNTAGETAFLARLTEGVAANPFLTGGIGGATDYDALYVASAADGLRDVAVRGSDASAMFDDLRYAGDQFITRIGPGRLNNAGELAFFANAGPDPLGTDSLGLFVYDVEGDVYNRIFQTSGSDFEDIFTLGDSVDGLTFSPTTEAFFHELAVNDAGDVVFTADVFAEVGSPVLRGLFFAGAGGLQTLALEGGEIDVTGGGRRTISVIEFLGGSSSSGRPSGLGDSGATAFGLVFADGASGVFLDTFEPVVVEDFLWSGDCGSTDWHDGCGASNWDNRNTGADAPRLPGTDPADRVFVVGADVVLEDRAVELFSIDATGSLTVRSALTLAQASGIEDLDLAADLSIGDTLTLSGANGVWRSGTIAGAGGLVLAGSASESGRLVVDSPGTVTLDTAATVGSIGNLAVDGGVLQIGETGSLLVDGLEAALTLTGGRIAQSAANPERYAVVSTGQLVKSGPGAATVEAGYRQLDGVGLIGGGELVFAGDVLLGMATEILEGATLTFGAADGAIWEEAAFTGAGVLRLDGAALDVRGNVSIDFSAGGELVLDGGAGIVADTALDVGADTTVRKIGSAGSAVSGAVLRGSARVEAGVLSIARSDLLGSEVTVDAGAELVFEGEPTSVGAEVTLTGDGLARFDDASIRDDPASDDDLLILDLDSVWNGVTWQGESDTVLGDPGITQPSLAVRNRRSARVEPGATATLDTVTFINGESPGISLGREPAAGTFLVPAGATLAMSGAAELTNTVDSSVVVDGDIVVRDGASPTDVQIFNRGTMALRGSVLVEAAPVDDRSASVLTNNGELMLAGGSQVQGALVNGSTGTLIVDGGEAVVGDSAGGFANRGTVLVSDGTLRVIQWDDATVLTLGEESGDPSTVLEEGAWEVENASVFGPNFFADVLSISEGVRLRLSGDAYFQGLPRVSHDFFQNGTLELEDLAFEVDSGGSFFNNGTLRLDGATIEAFRVINNGTVEIGASPGTATIDGDFEHAGVLEIELAGTRPGIDYDQLVVNGTTTFQPGGQISITLLDPDEGDGVSELFTPRTGDVFEIIVTDELVLAAGVDADALVTFTNAPGGLRFDVDVLEQDGLFGLLLNAQFGIDQALLGTLTGNPLAVAGYVDGLLKSGALDDDPRLDAVGDLAVLDGVTFAAVADQLHAEAYASAPTLGAFERVWAVTDALARQTRGVAGPARRGVWLTGLGGASDADGSADPRTSGFDGDHAGVLFGGDLALGSAAWVGAFVGHERQDQQFKDLPGDLRYDGNVYGLYGGFSTDSLSVSGYLSYQDGESDSERRIAGPSLAQTVGGEFDLDTLAVHVAGVWPALWQRGAYQIRPVTGLTFVDVDRQGLRERGGAFALDVTSGDAQALFADVGVTLFGGGDGPGLRPQLLAGWRFDADHERQRATASLSGLGGDGFVATGSRLPRGMGYVSGSLTWTLDNRVRLFVGYDGTFSEGYSSHGGQVGVRIPL